MEAPPPARLSPTLCPLRCHLCVDETEARQAPSPGPRRTGQAAVTLVLQPRATAGSEGTHRLSDHRHRERAVSDGRSIWGTPLHGPGGQAGWGDEAQPLPGRR